MISLSNIGAKRHLEQPDNIESLSDPQVQTSNVKQSISGIFFELNVCNLVAVNPCFNDHRVRG